MSSKLAIIFVGAPCSGKTTIGKLLEKKICDSVYIDQDMCDGCSELYHKTIFENNGKTLILGKCHQTISILNKVLNILNELSYKYYIFDLFPENMNDLLTKLMERLKIRQDNSILIYNNENPKESEDIIKGVIQTYDKKYRNKSTILNYLDKPENLMNNILEITKIIDSKYDIIDMDTNIEMSKMNECLTGENIRLRIETYYNYNNVMGKLSEWYKIMKFDLGTICKYYRKLYEYLRQNDKMDYTILQLYSNNLKTLESEYRFKNSENKSQKVQSTNEEIELLMEQIRKGMNETSHQSMRIIGKYYMEIDYNQPQMFEILLSDFEKTALSEEYGTLYYLNMNTGVWKLKEREIKVSKDFIEYVKEQHGKKTATNLRYLVGKQNTFEKYSTTTGTSTFSRMFSKIYGIDFNTFIYKMRSNLEYRSINEFIDKEEKEFVVKEFVVKEDKEVKEEVKKIKLKFKKNIVYKWM